MGSIASAENPPLSRAPRSPRPMETPSTTIIARMTAPVFSVNLRQPHAMASAAENPCADDGGAGGGGGGGGGTEPPESPGGGGGTEPYEGRPPEDSGVESPGLAGGSGVLMLGTLAAPRAHRPELCGRHSQPLP